ncbi:hypothetical protein CMV_016291 [Castanea mollissima]|uniref:Uncharacterized protein n=1 Tax=Castanea mollissima TaxID=60419 RepID=A0A8J4VID7_9ROSI|nr:hypothetical protein CMV_016291 [Castanea mollissima]
MGRWWKRDGSVEVEKGRKRDGLVEVEVEVGWCRKMDGSVEVGQGRKREVPKLPSPVVGLVGTTMEPWVGGWFWASSTVPFSLLWLRHGVNDETQLKSQDLRLADRFTNHTPTNTLASPALDPITVHNHTRVESAEKQEKEEEREHGKLKNKKKKGKKKKKKKKR